MSVDQTSRPASQRNLSWRNNTSPSGVHFWHRKRDQVERLLTRNVALPAGAQVVDFGAGAGADVLLLAGVYPDAKVLALDMSRERVEELKDRFSDLPAVSVEWADLRERLPFEDSSVDLGHCSEVLEHIPEPRGVLSEVHRVIKPGGYFLITTPNEPNVLQRGFWLRRQRQLSGNGAGGSRSRKGWRSSPGVRQELDLYGHISLGTIAEWDAMLSQAGFELADFARGALTYGGRRWLDREGALAALFASEALIDLAPRRLTRMLSDQLIGLYRRV